MLGATLQYGDWTITRNRVSRGKPQPDEWEYLLDGCGENGGYGATVEECLESIDIKEGRL